MLQMDHHEILHLGIEAIELIRLLVLHCVIKAAYKLRLLNDLMLLGLAKYSINEKEILFQKLNQI